MLQLATKRGAILARDAEQPNEFGHGRGVLDGRANPGKQMSAGTMARFGIHEILENPVSSRVMSGEL